MTALPGAPTPGEERERAFGLLLFDAEESLARGEAEKAMVLASKAVKERPDSFTARALIERARQELTRGRRREKLEARIVEAERLLDAGEFAAAEKIVTSALKLVPDHAVALSLFGRLRDRPRATTAEAEADRELERMARAQAQKALEAARDARAAGWDRRAIFHLRRGLRQAPDHPELLAMLGETHGAVERLDAERARKRASAQQVRAGVELLAKGDLDGALKILRAVLEEDPDNARAQAAVQDVRRAFIARQNPRSAAAPAGVARDAAAVAASTSPRAAARREPRRSEDAVADRSLPFVPVEILLPRTRRHRTPPALILGGAALLVAGVVLLSGRGAPGLQPTLGPAAATVPASPTEAPPAAAPEATLPEGPLAQAEPLLRSSIQAAIAAYARALETGDEAALARARPDLTAAARQQRLTPFLGALNAATDVRVLDVTVEGDTARVSILSTDVIIGGRGAAPPPSEESLTFERRRGVWELAGPPR